MHEAGLDRCNDDVALAVLAPVRRVGRGTPEDVTVLDVEHSPVGQLSSPPRTTIDLNVRAIMDGAIRDLHLAAPRDVSGPRARGELARLARGSTS